MRDGVETMISQANERQYQYKNSLNEANQAIVEFQSLMQEYKEKLLKFEEERCEQIHSSINQFVVFEKFAEMNNKYDVKNFSDLIDKFDLNDEVNAV